MLRLACSICHRTRYFVKLTPHCIFYFLGYVELGGLQLLPKRQAKVHDDPEVVKIVLELFQIKCGVVIKHFLCAR